MNLNDEHWEQLKDNIRKKFDVIDEGTEDLLMDSAEGSSKQGTMDILVVGTPMGEVKVVREARPMVLEKKYHYSHRQGSAAQTEYKLSDSEKSYKLRVYRWNEGEDDWEELDTGAAQGLL